MLYNIFLIGCWILFANTLFRIFAAYSLKYIDLKLCACVCVCMCPSDLDINIVLALLKELGIFIFSSTSLEQAT